jgi:putative phage-type endonuclease
MTTQDRQDFLGRRRTGIGSSDAAKVLGISKWGSALDVYLDKVHPPDPGRPMTTAQEFGIRLEPVIAAAASDRWGCKFTKPLTVAHPEFPYLIASVDRLDEEGDVCEFKTASRADGWGATDTDEVPQDYWIQVQHQLAVMDAVSARGSGGRRDFAWLYVLIGGSDFRRYRVGRDHGYLLAFGPAFAEFWRGVEARIPPEPDLSHPTVIDSLRRLYPLAEGRAVEAEQPALVRSFASGYQEAGEGIKLLEAKRGEYKAAIAAMMGDAQTMTAGPGCKVTRKTVARRGYAVEPTSYETVTINFKG